jgi:predicted DNA-binding transcriptional regulator AlpA
MSSPAHNIDRLLEPSEVAEILGVRPSTLVRWRRLKQGPPYIRVGHRTVRYQQSAITAWMAAQTNRRLVALPRPE